MSSVLIPGERVRARELRRTRRDRVLGRVRRLDWLMLFALAGVAALGLDVIGTGAGAHAFVVKQEIYLALGAVALCALSFIDVERFRRLEWPLYIGTIALVAAVFALGFSTRGSRRWIQFPFFQFQPSELGKLTLLLALAALIARNAGRIGTLRFVVLTIAYAALPAALVFIEPDFGTALVYVASLFCVLFVAGVRLRHLALLGGIAALLSVAVLWALPAGGVAGAQALPGRSPHVVPASRSATRLRRATTSPRPRSPSARAGSSDAGSRARPRRSTISFPERRTDFVFAVLGEERGFVGAMLLLGLYLVVLWRILRAIAVARTLYRAPDLRRRVRLAAGVGLHQRRHDDRHRARHGHPAAAALGGRLEHDHGAGRDRRRAVDPAARAPAAAPAARAPRRPHESAAGVPRPNPAIVRS